MDHILEFDLNEILDLDNSELKMNQDWLFRIEQFSDFTGKLSKSGYMHKMNWHMTKKNDLSYIKITFERDMLSQMEWVEISRVKNQDPNVMGRPVVKELAFFGELTGLRKLLKDSVRLKQGIQTSLAFRVNSLDTIDIFFSLEEGSALQQFNAQVFFLKDQMQN